MDHIIIITSSGLCAKRVDNMVIVRQEHPETKLTEQEDPKIRGELSGHALHGQDVRITCCHLEHGPLVIGCATIITKDWLEKQVRETSPLRVSR